MTEERADVEDLVMQVVREYGKPVPYSKVLVHLLINSVPTHMGDSVIWQLIEAKLLEYDLGELHEPVAA